MRQYNLTTILVKQITRWLFSWQKIKLSCRMSLYFGDRNPRNIYTFHIILLWNLLTYSMAKKRQRFREAYYPYLQGKRRFLRQEVSTLTDYKQSITLIFTSATTWNVRRKFICPRQIAEILSVRTRTMRTISVKITLQTIPLMCLILIKQGAGWAADPNLTLWRSEESPAPARNRNTIRR